MAEQTNNQQQKQQTNDNGNGALVVDLGAYKVRVGNKTMSPLDIAREALDVQARVGTFSEHFWQLAKQCQTPHEFDALCDTTAHVMKWGRPPAGTPEKEREEWTGAPDTWKVIRSTISRAWHDYGVHPGAVIEYVPKGAAKPEKERLEVSGINKLKTAVRIKREQKAAGTPTVKPDAALKEVYDSLTRVYAGLSADDQSKLIARLKKAATDFEKRMVMIIEGESEAA